MPEAGKKGRRAIDSLLGGAGGGEFRPKLPRFSPGPVLSGDATVRRA